MDTPHKNRHVLTVGNARGYGRAPQPRLRHEALPMLLPQMAELFLDAGFNGTVFKKVLPSASCERLDFLKRSESFVYGILDGLGKLCMTVQGIRPYVRLTRSEQAHGES